MPNDDGLPESVRLPDGSVVSARPTDGGAGIEITIEPGQPGQVVRFPTERTRPPDDSES